MTYQQALDLITLRKSSSSGEVSFISWCPHCDPPTKKEVFVSRAGEEDAKRLLVGGMITHWRREHGLKIEEAQQVGDGDAEEAV